MELIGTIVRLQVQRASLKVGESPRRRYEPAPLCRVPALSTSRAGVSGITEASAMVLDVHHQDHPASKNSGGMNGISVGFSSSYQAMRRRFGDHLEDGVAGENVLVQTDPRFGEFRPTGPLVVETAEGEHLLLERIVAAEPCVEFSRYALCYPPDAPSDSQVSEALSFLRHGMRGYYATYAGEPRLMRLGDRVYLR